MATISGTPINFGTPNDLTTAAISGTLPSTTVNDVGYCFIVTSNGTSTPPTMSSAPAGWVLEGSATDAGSNAVTVWLYSRVIGASEPTALTWTLSGGSNTVAFLWCVAGLDPAGPHTQLSVAAHGGAGAARTTAAITTTISGPVFSGFADRTGSAGAFTGGTDTLITNGNPVHNGSSQAYVQWSVSDVAPTVGLVRTITGAATSIGASFIFEGVPAPASGPTVTPAAGTVTAGPVAAYGEPLRSWAKAMWDGGKGYVAHRLGSASLVEHTAAAAQTLIDLKVAAMEISMWMTTDGVWLASHDRTTDRVFGTTGGNVSCDIPTSTYAQVLAATPNGTIVGGYPIARVVDLLALIPATTVVFVDNKRATDITAFLDMLDGFPNASNRFVVKGIYGIAPTVAAAARARGYKCWLYYYEADLAQIPSTIDSADFSGMDYLASGAAWTTIKAYGKPVLGHVCTTNAHQATAFGLGADGVMTGLVYNGLPNAPVAAAAGTAAAGAGGVIPSVIAATGTAAAGDGTVLVLGGPNMYASLAKLKTQLGIPVSDTTRDSQLTDVLVAVSASIDDMCGRTFTAVTGNPTTRTFKAGGRVRDTEDGPMLMVDDIGSPTGLTVSAGTAVTGYTTVGAALLELTPLEAPANGRPSTGVLLLSGAWPTGYGKRIRVTADWGWPTVPAVVVQATLIQAARIFKRKDSPEGILGGAEWGALRLSRVDPDVQALLAPLRLNVAGMA